MSDYQLEDEIERALINQLMGIICDAANVYRRHEQHEATEADCLEALSWLAYHWDQIDPDNQE